MVFRLPRRDRGALLRRLTPAIPAALISRADPLPANREAIGLQLGVNARRAPVGPSEPAWIVRMRRVRPGVGGRPSRKPSAPPSVIARGRNLQDAGHHTNGIHGLVRARRPVNPLGSPCSPARTRPPPLPGYRAPVAGDGKFSRRRRTQLFWLDAGWSVRALAGRTRSRACCPQVEIDWAVGSNSRASSSGRASRSHQIDQLSPELRQISGSNNAAHQTPPKSTSRVSTKPGQLQPCSQHRSASRCGNEDLPFRIGLPSGRVSALLSGA